MVGATVSATTPSDLTAVSVEVDIDWPTTAETVSVSLCRPSHVSSRLYTVRQLPDAVQNLSN